MSTPDVDDAPIKTLHSSREKCGRFTYVSDQVLVHGVQRPYDYIDIHSGVCILPIYQGKICLLREYRYPIKSYQYQLPGGFIDEGEAVEVAAQRELLEETGLVSDHVIDLGSFYPSFGSTNEEIHLAAAICTRREKPQQEVSEVIEPIFMTKDEVFSLVAQGKFKHGAGLVALFKYFSIYEAQTQAPASASAATAAVDAASCCQPEFSTDVSPDFNLQDALYGVHSSQSEDSHGFSVPLGICFKYLSPELIKAEIKVTPQLCRPTAKGFILHGGATLACAETIAGVGSLVSCAGRFNPCGVSITANHVAMALVGDCLQVKATRLHAGARNHLWNIDFSNKQGELVSAVRVTNALIPEA